MTDFSQAELSRRSTQVLMLFYMHIKGCPDCQYDREYRLAELERLKKKYEIPVGWKEDGFIEDADRIYRQMCTVKAIKALLG